MAGLIVGVILILGTIVPSSLDVVHRSGAGTGIVDESPGGRKTPPVCSRLGHYRLRHGGTWVGNTPMRCLIPGSPGQSEFTTVSQLNSFAENALIAEYAKHR